MKDLYYKSTKSALEAYSAFETHSLAQKKLKKGGGASALEELQSLQQRLKQARKELEACVKDSKSRRTTLPSARRIQRDLQSEIQDLKRKINVIGSQLTQKNTNQSRRPSIQLSLEQLHFKPTEKPNLEETGSERSESSSIIGDNSTLIAFKNEASYLIVTSKSGLMLVEDEKIIYKEELDEDCWIMDVAFIDCLNAYLIDYDRKLFLKGVDNRPPRPFFCLECGSREAGSFKYSFLHDRLIVNHQGTSLAVLNLQTRKMGVNVGEIEDEEIADFELLGEDEDRVIALTWGGFLSLNSLFFSRERGVVKKAKIELLEDRNEQGVSVAVCPRSEYACVMLGDEELASRVMVFSVGDRQLKGEEGEENDGYLILQATIDLWEYRIGQMYAFTSCGYFGNSLLFLGLGVTFFSGPVGCLFAFDPEDADFVELGEKRFDHKELNPYRVQRLQNGRFYYTGEQGSVRKLEISLQE